LGRRVLPWVVVVAAVTAFGLPSLTYPLGRDQAACVYVAERWCEGGVPYVAAWENRSIGIFAVYAAALRIVRSPTLVVRVVDLLATLVVALSVAALLARVGSDRLAVFGGALCGLLYYLFFDYWCSAQAEGLGSAAMAGAIASALAGRGGQRSAVRQAVTGVCCGLAILTKTTFALPVAAVIGWLMWRQWAASRRVEEGRRRWWTQAGPLLGGIVAPWVIAVVYLAGHGAWGEFAKTFAFQRSYVSVYLERKGAFGAAVEGVPAFVLHFAVIIVLALCGLIAGRRDETTRELAAVSGWWLVGSVAAVAVQMRYYWYHWALVIPPMALPAALGLRAWWRWVRHPQTTSGRGAAIVLAVGGLAAFLHGPPQVAAGVPSWRAWEAGYPRRWRAMRERHEWPWLVPDSVRFEYVDCARLWLGRLTREEYEQRFVGPYRFDFAQQRRVAEFIKQHSRPEETILVGGFDPVMYVLAQRRAPTRFFDLHLLGRDVAPFARQSGWDREVLAALRRHPPRYIVYWEPLPGVVLVPGAYRLDANFGGLMLWRRL